ncbi:Hsp70 family protein [Pseudonocardia parietis]|uniref:Actin-like ATPase involved in cell morphogenesis n=1 Tax=Pseudonocardia parietis TaxID=570936 RepID=A0ABS4VQW9_9PSEU|nr:Hsp70 family protein [Pseudonocardia parietis]MBP2366318.1 actin-like ATPase involved in cell morphogenesis [Pseudonocardia parietis]
MECISGETMGYLLGIDVGTTRTAAAVIRPGTPGPEMITLGDRSVDIPSVVYVAADGSLLFGEAAERRALTEPDRVAREFKRRIGDPTPIPLGEHAFTAEQLSALLTEHVVEVVSRTEGGPPERVAVSHPASWGSHKRDLFAGALADRALSVTFLTEPQAAALHYATNERVEAGATVAVYDLGGGTFDAAVVRKEAAGTTDTGGTVVGGTLFTLLGRPEGLEQLGGADFDQAVVDHVRDAVPQAFEALDEADPDVLTQMARLRRDCREAKEALSADTEVSIPVWLGEVRTTVRLHRSDLEDRIRPRLEESVEALQRAIASAGLAASGPSVVLLVGGSSRVPLVAQLVSSELGRPIQVDADPKNAIGKGAVLALGPVDPVTAAPAGAGFPPGGAGAAGAAVLGATGSSAPATSALAADPGPLPWENGPPMTERMAADAPPTAFHGPQTAYLDGADADPPTDRIPIVPPPYGGHPGADPGTAVYGGYAETYDGETTVAPEPSGPRRSPALLIGAGGVVAALAVLSAVFFWPQDRNVSNATPELPAMPTTTEAAPITTEEETPVRQEPEPTRERTTAPRTTSEDVPLPPPPPPPPVTTPEDPPPTSSSKPPPTSSSDPPPTSSSTTPPPDPSNPSIQPVE